MQKLLLVVAGIIFILPAFCNAQVTTQALGNGPTLELSPAYPAPHSSAVATLNNYAGSAEESNVSWRVNGIEQTPARNQRELTFTTQEPGKTIIIEALTSVGRLQKVVVPQYVDLIVEPQTRVPAHYGGRSLPSVGSSVNVTAVTGGATPTQNLTYTWRINGTVLGGGPVRGQAQVSFTMPTGGATIEVLVESSTGVVGAQTAQLMNTDPFLYFYSYNSLYGLSMIPIRTSLTLVGNSATVRAEPYYLDLRTYNNPDIAQWDTGTRLSSSPSSNPYELNILRSDYPSSVNFHVRNLTEVLQGAQGGFSIQ